MDTGNLLFRKSLQTETKRKDALLRVDLLIQSHNEMGYEAMNVGEKDLMMGVPFLSEVSQKARFPLISANLIDKKSHKEVFKPSVIKEMMGLKIGVFGLLNDQFNEILQEEDPHFMILDPFPTGKAIIKNLREKCDLIILLSQLGEARDRRFARENPQVDLILGGGGESQRAVMEKINEVSLYRLEPRGGYLGRLDFTLFDVGRPIRFIASSEREEIEKRLERLETRSMQIKSEILRSNKQEEMRAKELKFLESKKKELGKALLAFEEKNFYRHRAIPVQLSVEDDPKIMKGVEVYRGESGKLYRTKGGGPPEKELSEKEILARIPKDSSFVGSISCKKCHEASYRRWLKTKHAQASQTIGASPKYAQEECLLCHSTGYGKVAEYATIEEIPPHLRGVQCEACHGEGKGHPEKGRVLLQVTLGACRRCHTRDQSPAFNYTAYLDKIGCNVTK